MKRIDLSPDVRDVAVFDVPVNGTPGLAVFVSIETPTGWYGAQFVIDYPDSHKHMAGKIPINTSTQISLKRDLIVRQAATASRIPDVMARSLWPYLKTILSQAERVNDIKTPQLELSLYFGQRSGEPIRHHVDQMALPAMPVLSMGYTPPAAMADLEPEGSSLEPDVYPFTDDEPAISPEVMTTTLNALRRRIPVSTTRRSAAWYSYEFALEDLRLMRDYGFPDIEMIRDAIEMLEIPERRERQEAIQAVQQSRQAIEGQTTGPAIIITDAEPFEPVLYRGRTLQELLQVYRDFIAPRPSDLSGTFTREELQAIQNALDQPPPVELRRAIDIIDSLTNPQYPTSHTGTPRPS